MKKILFFSIYPAPYRVNLFKYFNETYDCDVFFLKSNGDERNENWFTKGKYYTLDIDEGKKAYKNKVLESYDLVVFYDYSMIEAINLIARCRLKKIPYVINCDGVMLTSHGNFFRDILKRYLIGGASACLASGENAKQYFLKYGAKKDKIFLHTFSTLDAGDILLEPISVEHKKKLREKLGLPSYKKIAIAVGRFIALKRYTELLHAWKNMPKDFFLLLVGGGEEEADYRELIKKLGLSNVRIEGFHVKDELMEYYKASDLFIHPTSYDVWGLVVNEAMACGLPVVVSDHCIAGLELIRDGLNGYKIPMGDDMMMCRRMTEVLSDERLSYNMARNALNTIKPYTMENMAKSHIDVFENILEK